MDNTHFIVAVECSDPEFIPDRPNRPCSIGRSVANPCKHYVYFKERTNYGLLNLFGIHRVEFLNGNQIHQLYTDYNYQMPDHFKIYGDPQQCIK